MHLGRICLRRLLVLGPHRLYPGRTCHPMRSKKINPIGKKISSRDNKIDLIDNKIDLVDNNNNNKIDLVDNNNKKIDLVDNNNKIDLVDNNNKINLVDNNNIDLVDNIKNRIDACENKTAQTIKSVPQRKRRKEQSSCMWIRLRWNTPL